VGILKFSYTHPIMQDAPYESRHCNVNANMHMLSVTQGNARLQMKLQGGPN